MNAEQYFVLIDGQTAGPFSTGELSGLYVAGQITAETLYSKPGGVDWMPLASIVPLLNVPDESAKPKAGLYDHVCTTCGCVGRPQRVKPGSGTVEVALWLLFIAPGVIYTLWRISSKYRVCAQCKSRKVIPAISPEGLKLVRME